MTDTVTIFANKPNKLSFNVEVAGIEQSTLQPRLSLFCDQLVLSFPLKHENETTWTATVEHGFQDTGPCNARGKIEIICNGHFLESDEFDVEIKGEVKVQHQPQPTDAPTEASTSAPVQAQPQTTNFTVAKPQLTKINQPVEDEKPKQRTDEQQENNKDAAVRDLLQSMGIAPKPKLSKFKLKGLRDYIPD